MSKRPSLQWYPGDWKKDPGIQALDFFDRGVWFEIVMLMHESSERGVLLLNGKPMSDEALARNLGLDKERLTTTLTTLLEYGVAHRRESDGALFNKRMVRDEKTLQERIKAGKMGGNPNLLKGEVNQMDNQPPKQDPTPSSSSSSSSSDLLFRGALPKKIDTEEVRKAITYWQQKVRPKKQISDLDVEQLMLNYSSYTPVVVAAALRDAGSKGWLTLQMTRANSHGPPGKPPQKTFMYTNAKSLITE